MVPISNASARSHAATAGQLERVARPFGLDAIAARMAPLPAWPLADALEIGTIADEIGRMRYRIAGGGRDEIGPPRAKPDDDEAATHSRRPRPGMSTMEK